MNGSPLVMAAALAVLTKVLTPDAYPRLVAMGDRPYSIEQCSIS